MVGVIPPIELRIRGFFNGRDDLDELLQEFYDHTGIRRSKIFRKGVLLAQNPEAFNTPREDGLKPTPKEDKALNNDHERTKSPDDEKGRFVPRFQGSNANQWSDLPWPLWKLVILCAIGATVQGWDEAAVNGAQVWYQAAFNIHIDDPCGLGLVTRPTIAGLVNSAPYLGCVASCWFTPWLNGKLGRRGTIFWCAIFSTGFALAQAFVQSWEQLFAFRLLLGLGIGPKSATIPIYAAECVPGNVRGSLVMFWQVWTAFGIMAGSIAGVALQHLGSVSDDTICHASDPSRGITSNLLSWQCSQNWRLVLASPAILPFVLAAYIYTCHESPRWTVAQAHALHSHGEVNKARLWYQKAFRALSDMSRDPLLAARDMVSHFFLLRQEKQELVRAKDVRPSRPWLFHQFAELFLVRRNGRAILASSICMFAQQFCGVNFIIYYSNIVFRSMSISSIPDKDRCTKNLMDATDFALLYTMGFGILNLLFAIPAFFTIDTTGRRTLLLTTFPLLTVCHVITAIGTVVKSDGMILTGMYLFAVFYSPGEGPVPFVYAAESMPLHIREKGMALVVSINWLFCWFIAFTGPGFLQWFGHAQTFAWYAGWCLLLWFIILLLVPETRALTLEQLDCVFHSVSVTDFAKHSWRSFLWRCHISNKAPGRLYEIERSDAANRQDTRTRLISRSTEVARDGNSDTLSDDDEVHDPGHDEPEHEPDIVTKSSEVRMRHASTRSDS